MRNYVRQLSHGSVRSEHTASQIPHHYHVPLTDFYGDGVTMAGMASKRGKKEKSGFGTLFGVYIPCVLNILGTLLFIRTPWMAAQAGLLASTGIVFLCVACTTLTALSLSALATNTKIPAGGPYAIVTQNLGPEFGGSIGILFYLGTTIAVTMEALGGIETLISTFDLYTVIPVENCLHNATKDCTTIEPLFPWDRQILSIVSVLILGAIVHIGMKFVARTSIPILFVVIMALVLSVGSAFAFFSGIWKVDGIKKGSPSENLLPDYSPDIQTGAETTFISLISLFFPAATGILGGSNRSGVLRNPARSIPYGTLGAILTTTLMYLLVIWTFGSTISNETLKEDKLIAATVSWPTAEVVGAGIAICCFGAGAPELLKSMANDGHISFLNVFATDHEADEPVFAIRFTIGLAAICCLAGNLDYITPIITMFFLAMYGSINLACFGLSILKNPGFRPRWIYFHWSSALAGFLLCSILSFVISVLYAFISLFLVVGLFIYILLSREKKEWGDAIVGWRLEQATSALLALNSNRVSIRPGKFSLRSRQGLKRRLKAGAPKDFLKDLENGENLYINGETGFISSVPRTSDSKDLAHLQGNNWRPQILLLCKLNVKSLEVTQPHLLDLAAQLKKGRGLIIAVAMVHGDVMHEGCIEFAQKAQHLLDEQLAQAGVKGFSDVCLGSGPDLLEPLRILIQSQGLGPLSPNTVMLNWPDRWREDEDHASSGVQPDEENIEDSNSDPIDNPDIPDKTLRHKLMYVNLLKSSIGCGKAVFVVKGTEGFPGNHHRLSGNIDVWLLMHDGGIVLLLSYLLQRHRVWRSCTLRIFVIAPENLVDIEMTRNNFISHLQNQRIDAEVKIVSVSIADAMDIDRNRTIRVQGPSGHNSIIDHSLFVPPSSTDLHLTDTGEEKCDPAESKAEEEWAKEFCSRVQGDESSLDEESGSSNLFGPDYDSDGEVQDHKFQKMGSTGKDSDLEKPFVLPEREIFRNNPGSKKPYPKDARSHLHFETAKHLNCKIREHSEEANLVVINLPLSRSTLPTEFIDYTNTLTEGLERVIMIRGSGNERITEYDPNV